VAGKVEAGEKIGPSSIVTFSDHSFAESPIFSKPSHRYESCNSFKEFFSFYIVYLYYFWSSNRPHRLTHVTLPPFEPHQVECMLAQHEKIHNVKFDETAVYRLLFVSNGHPWLVNRVLSQLTKSKTFAGVTLFNVGPPLPPSWFHPPTSFDNLFIV
jgi:hypothetical protein